MARYVDAIDLPLSPDEAFGYLADFSHTAEWDPGVVEAKKLTPGELRVGTRFHVVSSFFGQRVPLEYRISVFDRPHRLVLTAGPPGLRSIDEILFSPRAQGTRVTYEARLELGGLRAIADPLLDLVFQRIGRDAAAGLRERFANVRAPYAPLGEKADPPASRSTTRKRAEKPRTSREERSSEGVAG